MSAPLEAAIVFMVNVAVALPPAASVTLAGFRLQVGRLCAPEGEVVSAHVRFMVPEYVLPAFRVAVVVALAPGAIEGGTVIDITTGTTVTVVVPVASA